MSISAPILAEHVAKNLNSKVRHGSLRTIKFLLLGYPQPRTYAERLVQSDSYWRNYTDYLPVLSEDIYWTVELRRNLTCADTGLIRLVILDENMRNVVNVEGRTPLIGKYHNLAEGKIQFHYTFHLTELSLQCSWVLVSIWRRQIVIETCRGKQIQLNVFIYMPANTRLLDIVNRNIHSFRTPANEC
jgi:hypothetical protein